jgi:hypothetical protein
MPLLPVRLSAALLLAAATLLASAPASAQQQPRAIQDNSFLVEEAYNQEDGVVQHISMFTRFWMSRDLVYTFTQEWPVPRRFRHQLSYTLAAVHAGAVRGSGIGFGDVALNYRYQLFGNGESRIAFAPRLSVLAPSGEARLGRSTGGWGVQTSLPLSVVVNRSLVTHWNAGATFVPHAADAAGNRAATHGYNLGQSFIWLVRPRFNVMLETVWTGTEAVTGPGATQRQHSLLLSPGVRWAYNFSARGLQIVPGIGVPLGVGPSAGERGIVLYLSFEHRMWGRPRPD